MDDKSFTDEEALLFHSSGRPGKLQIAAIKPLMTLMEKRQTLDLSPVA